MNSRTRTFFCRGFSLLEILIAVLVLSIGVLGLAGLQFYGLKEGQTSYLRSQAVLLTYEIADRMRADRSQAKAGSFALTTIGAAAAKKCAPEDPPGVTVATPDTCTTLEQVAYDLKNWDDRVRSTLPGGRASIACTGTCAFGAKQTVTVYWDEARTGATGTGCNPDVATDLACVTTYLAP